jgi:hypothetical protein
MELPNYPLALACAHCRSVNVGKTGFKCDPTLTLSHAITAFLRKAYRIVSCLSRCSRC